MQKLLNKRDIITKYLLAAILLAIPIYPKFPFIRIPGTHVAIRLEDILMLVSGIFVSIFIVLDIKRLFKDKIKLSVLLFLASGLLSLVSAIFITKTVFPTIAILHYLRRIEYFIPLFLGMMAFGKGRKDLEFYIKVILISIFIVFVYGLGQKHFSWPVIATQNEEVAKGIAQLWTEGSHLYSTFAGHYDLATYLVLVMPVLITMLFVLKGKFTRLALLAASFGGLWLLSNSLSRISVVSYLMAVSLSLLFAKKYKAIPIVIITSLLVFGLSSSLLDRYSRIIQVTRERIEKIMYVQPKTAFAATDTNLLERRKNAVEAPTPTPIFEDRSTSIRIKVEWPRALRALKKNPLLGTGYSSITLATDNDYLRVLGEVGIAGALSFLLLLANIVILFAKYFPFSKNFKGIELAFIAGMGGALPGVFLNAVFIDIFEASKFAIIFWTLIGISISLIRKNINEEII